MTDYVHDQVLLADAANFTRAPNASVTVYDANDASNSTPLALKDINGLALANPMVSSADAFTPAFVTTSPLVKLVGGGLAVLSASYKGLRDEALAAKAEAEAAAQDAAAAAELAQAPTDAQVDAGVARANIPGQVGAVVPPLVTAQVTPMVPPLVAQAIASDPTVAKSAATLAQSSAGLVPKWKPNTAYVAGQQVVSPSGDVVSAKANFTSGAAYSETNWNLSRSLKFRGNLPLNADLNTYFGLSAVGVWGIPSATISNSLVNAPTGVAGTAGTFTVESSDNGVTFQTIKLYSASFKWIARTSNNLIGTSYQPWKTLMFDDGSGLRTFPALTSGADLHSLTVPGVYPVNTGTVAASLVNSPTDQPGFVQVLATTNGIYHREYVQYGTFKKWEEITQSVTSGAMNPWVQTWPISGGGGTVVVSDAGLTNSILVQDFTRQMGGRKKVTTATIAFRFDHGLNNFDAYVRSEMEARGFKYSLALCSGQWSRTENNLITPSMVNTWVAGGLAEIWNHSKDHGSGDNSEASWKAAILDGLTELQTQIPACAGKVWGFAPPGSAGTNFGGFIDGTTLDQFYGTDGGRFLHTLHAVVAGYIGATKRWQDGMVRQGLGHITLDSRSLAQVQADITAAKNEKRALQYMLHPSLMNNGTNMSSATWVSILDYVKAEETAGRLKVVSPYEQMLCDVT